MADGTFAALLLIAGLTDMSSNYCGTATGCLGTTESVPRVAFSTGTTLERRAEESPEIYLRYDFGRDIGPFGQALGISYGEESGSWLGYGFTVSGEGGRVHPDTTIAAVKFVSTDQTPPCQPNGFGTTTKVT